MLIQNKKQPKNLNKKIHYVTLIKHSDRDLYYFEEFWDHEDMLNHIISENNELEDYKIFQVETIEPFNFEDEFKQKKLEASIKKLESSIDDYSKFICNTNSQIENRKKRNETEIKQLEDLKKQLPSNIRNSTMSKWALHSTKSFKLG